MCLNLNDVQGDFSAISGRFFGEKMYEIYRKILGSFEGVLEFS